MTGGRSSGRWRCGGPCGSPRGTCSRLSWAARDAASRTPSDDGSPRKQSGRRRAQMAAGSATPVDLIVEYLTGREASTRQLRDALPTFGGSFTAAPGTKWSADVASHEPTAHDPDGRRPRRSRSQRRPLAHLPAAVDGNGRLARRASRRRSTRSRPTRGSSSGCCGRSGRRPKTISPGGSGRRRAPSAPPSPRSTRRPSHSTTGRSGGSRPTTPPISPSPRRPSRGSPSCRRSTRPRWAGASDASTSTLRTRRSCSTRPATPAPPCGWTGGSSAAGCRTNGSASGWCSWRRCHHDAHRRLDREAERLDAFLGGEHITNVFASPQVRRERLR